MGMELWTSSSSDFAIRTTTPTRFKYEEDFYPPNMLHTENNEMLGPFGR